MTNLARLGPSLPSLDAVWRADGLGGTACASVPSGYPALDAELPGAGWPRGGLNEVLQTQAGLHEWRLLVPALRACLAAAFGATAGPMVSSKTANKALARPARPVPALVLIGSPHPLNLPALACRGIPGASVLRVDAVKPLERLWAAEQALRCRDLAVLLLWSPHVRPEQLRRLQVAAQTTHPGALPPLVFVFRPWDAQHQSSPAPLRVIIRSASQGELAVQLLKRRGPPHDAPVLLPPDLPPALAHRQHPLRPGVVVPDFADLATDDVVDCPGPVLHAPATDQRLAA